MSTGDLSPGDGDQGAVVLSLPPEHGNVTVMSDEIKNDLMALQREEKEQILNSEEKRYLLYVERGDVASVKHILKKGLKENEKKADSFNINCLDPIGRSSLTISIENENLEMIELLLDQGIDPADALLHAISEEYVEGVEVLLQYEEKVHTKGLPYSWQMTTGERATFTSDMTPLIMAAHKNNYEILKLLLDRGATLPVPHDVKCACDECLDSSADDSLRHSLARINAYRALSSPSLICLSSTDPFVTAFSLSQDLRNLASLENEFMDDYNSLREQVQQFAMALVDETRTSSELEIVLNYDPEGQPYKKGEFMHFTLLKEAVNNSQKQFVAHANVQQLLGTVWYDGMPGFKRRGPIDQLLEVVKIGIMFPVYCSAFLASPTSKFGVALKKPFIRFIVHSSSYCLFLSLLVIVSLRLESLVIDLLGSDWMVQRLRRQEREARGGWPSFVELLIVVYIFGFIWAEIKTLWQDGLMNYIKNLWNLVDFSGNFLYMNWIFLRLTALFLTQRAVWSGIDPYYPREMWPPFDPLLLSEAMFCAGNIVSFLKLIHIFSINHHLGPLQIALGRMVLDIIKFFFIYTLVLFAFGCGLNQLLWYYADIDKAKCYSLPGGMMDPKQSKSCSTWRRFSNLFETSQSLYWASFGMVDLSNFELTGIKSFTRFWSMLMYGSYNVINVIVLLNLLIAMMSNSFTLIVEKCDVEWKFARSKLWMSYFEDGDEVPPPFNLFPSPQALFKEKKVTTDSLKNKNDSLRDTQYQRIMRNLVRRYVTAEQRKVDEAQITEDDINEVKQDISSFKYELLNILKINGMTTGNKHHKDNNAVGRKQQMRERRLMKGFNIGMVEGLDSKDILANLILKATGVKKEKGDWNNQVSKSLQGRDPIGSSTTNLARQSLRQNARGTLKTWSAVKYYQRRGVFVGGEINSLMLKEVKKREPPKIVQSQCKGWRALRKMHERGEIIEESPHPSAAASPSPTSPPMTPISSSKSAGELKPPATNVEVPQSPSPRPAEAPKSSSPKPPEASKSPSPKPAEAPKSPSPKPAEAPKSSSPKPAEVPKSPSPKPTEASKSPSPKPAEAPKSPSPKPADEPLVQGVSSLTQQKRTGWL